MGKELANNRFFAIVWWFKVFFAASLAIGGLAFLAANVVILHNSAIQQQAAGSGSSSSSASAAAVNAATGTSGAAPTTGAVPNLPPTVIIYNTSIPITISSDLAVCQANSNTLARLEPPAGKVYMGFDLMWESQLPANLTGLLEQNPAIINSFLDFDGTVSPGYDDNMMQWQGYLIQEIGGIYALTMQPNAAMANYSEAVLARFAQSCLKINLKGVPILLRYGHEMNGDWTTYGVHPVEYVAGFKLMANAIRAVTNLTAMVWSPNIGINYPFQSNFTAYPTLKGDPANFKAMDTNKDNVIDWQDDPYGPYYPGDDYVDWVGISLYWYPDSGTGFNGLVPPTYFADQLTGQGPTIAEFNSVVANDNGLRNFYGRFPDTSKKPFIISETGAPWVVNYAGTEAEPLVKQQWWSQFYSPAAFAQFPQLKGVVHFEEIKPDGTGYTRDYRILNNSAVCAQFLKDTQALSSTLLYAQDLSFSCNGQVTVAA